MKSDECKALKDSEDKLAKEVAFLKEHQKALLSDLDDQQADIVTLKNDNHKLIHE